MHHCSAWAANLFLPINCLVFYCLRSVMRRSVKNGCNQSWVAGLRAHKEAFFSYIHVYFCLLCAGRQLSAGRPPHLCKQPGRKCKSGSLCVWFAGSAKGFVDIRQIKGKRSKNKMKKKKEFLIYSQTHKLWLFNVYFSKVKVVIFCFVDMEVEDVKVELAATNTSI